MRRVGAFGESGRQTRWRDRSRGTEQLIAATIDAAEAPGAVALTML
jgi:hypothetical protein